MTTHVLDSARHLSDEMLLARVKHLAADERRATVALIELLAEVDRRRLYLEEGYSSLFTYCTEELRLSEHAAYGRIEAARAARRFPIILERLEEGSITLTTVCLLASLLTAESHRQIQPSATLRDTPASGMVLVRRVEVLAFNVDLTAFPLRLPRQFNVSWGLSEPFEIPPGTP